MLIGLLVIYMYCMKPCLGASLSFGCTKSHEYGNNKRGAMHLPLTATEVHVGQSEIQGSM